MNNSLVRNGFVAAGLMNIVGVLLFSRLFTNTAINQADPVVMSNFGLLMICLWGLAYLGASVMGERVKWLAAVFAVEKLVYGVNDLIFMLFFSWVFYSHARAGAR